eukprot:2652484-Amphidinium_carterae.1
MRADIQRRNSTQRVIHVERFGLMEELEHAAHAPLEVLLNGLHPHLERIRVAASCIVVSQQKIYVGPAVECLHDNPLFLPMCNMRAWEGSWGCYKESSGAAL